MIVTLTGGFSDRRDRLCSRHDLINISKTTAVVVGKTGLGFHHRVAFRLRFWFHRGGLRNIGLLLPRLRLRLWPHCLTLFWGFGEHFLSIGYGSCGVDVLVFLLR